MPGCGRHAITKTDRRPLQQNYGLFDGKCSTVASYRLITWPLTCHWSMFYRSIPPHFFLIFSVIGWFFLPISLSFPLSLTLFFLALIVFLNYRRVPSTMELFSLTNFSDGLSSMWFFHRYVTLQLECGTCVFIRNVFFVCVCSNVFLS